MGQPRLAVPTGGLLLWIAVSHLQQRNAVVIQPVCVGDPAAAAVCCAPPSLPSPQGPVQQQYTAREDAVHTEAGHGCLEVRQRLRF